MHYKLMKIKENKDQPGYKGDKPVNIYSAKLEISVN